MQRSVIDDIRYLKGVGPKRAGALNSLGISTIEDLFYYFPRRYEDRSQLVQISHLKCGEYQTLKGRIISCGLRVNLYKRPTFKIFEAIISDDTGSIACAWFNQPYLKNYLKKNTEVILYGRADIYGGHLQITNPEFEIVGNALSSEFLGILPFYGLTEGLTQRIFRAALKAAIDGYAGVLNDVLPFDIRQRHSLLNISESIRNLHFPRDYSLQEQGYRRILFEECFLLQLMFGRSRCWEEEAKGFGHKIDEEFFKVFEAGLSFELTFSQKKVISEIKSDMAKLRPMRRLLQGDVGSGKTIVALFGALTAVTSGHQAVFMAPTEILAQQHFEAISLQLSAFSSKEKKVKIALLTGSLNKKEKEKIYQEVKKGEIDILIGTHALIQEGLEFKSLSFVVVDEQHKFGVRQRLSALTKGVNPDYLIMTATPIPRTLALTLYADMDISTLTELPKGRQVVKTHFVTEEKRGKVYDFIRRQVVFGRQAYIVYPLIDESENLELKAARVMFEDFSRNIFKGLRVGLVHGRMEQKERARIMQDFRNAAIDILVSTVIIEVGIDVANASVIVIEHADRFGLSQLHQLRGRVGRGAHESHCILLSDSVSEGARARLKTVVNEADGFKVAEKDLELRGPGEFFGARQHGITALRVDPLSNLEIINKSRQEALALLRNDPRLIARQNQGLSGVLQKRFPDYEKFIKAS